MGDDSERRVSLGVLKLVVAAMTLGVIAFAVAVVFLGPRLNIRRDPNLAPVLLTALAGLAVLELLAFLVARAGTTRRLRASLSPEDDDERILEKTRPAFATLTIIGAAMAEGLGLFSVVIYLLTNEATALVATAVSLSLLIKQFPSESRLYSLASRVAPVE